MKIKFWGVRGSIPCPGPHTTKYGGNTACIELRVKEINRLVIIDAGSGIRELGNYLMVHDLASGVIKADIFLTHTHWDHIIGFPFFTPIYLPSTQLTIHGPVTYESDTLKEVLSGQWTYRYFPVRHEDLSSHIVYKNLKEGEYNLGQGLKVKTKYLNHPLLCLGYRFEYKDKIFCTAYDTEPFINVFTTDSNDSDYDPLMAAQGEQAADDENQRIGFFIEDADLLIYDTQYTQKEYNEAHIGWGHSPIEYAIDIARRNNVKKLALFHHDVQRTDAQMDNLSRQYCQNKDGFEVFFAREGNEIHI